MSPTRILERPSSGRSKRAATRVATTTGAPIDPRIRQRRVDVTRRRGQRRLVLILAPLIAAGFALVAWLALHSSLMAARHVQVVGTRHTLPAAIVDASGLSGSVPLIDIDPGRVAAAVEQLPWIRTVSVARHWPDAVVITVTERTPIAVVAGTGGSWIEVDRTGRVLEVAPPGPAPAGLVHLTVPQPPGGAGSTMAAGDAAGLAVAATLPPAFVAQVTAVSMGSGDQVDLTLNSQLSVNLGDASQLPDKYEDVASMLAHATFHPGDVIDVSVPSSPTVTGP